MTGTQWVPLALARDIAPGTSAGTMVEDAEIVVWRDTDGRAHAWEDRCPHRGMKLSFGFVRGDHIACLYHGWEFDEGGICRKIPAHPDLEVPGSICAARYGCTETGGMIWAALPLGTDPIEVPALPDAVPVRSITLEAGLITVADMLLNEENAVIEGALATLDCAHGPLAIGVQPIRPGTVALHITTRPGASAATLLAICDWAETLRRAAEKEIAA